MGVHLILTILMVAVAPSDPVSGPIGVYALVDKVEFEPKEGEPERIIIRGVFITVNDGDVKKAVGPLQGYLYYSLADHRPEGVRADWKEIKKAAGTNSVIAWGWRGAKNGTVRRMAVKPEKPDKYVLNVGVVRFTGEHWMSQRGRRLDGRVDAALVKKPLGYTRIISPADGGTVKPGRVKLTVKNIVEPDRKTVKYRFKIKNRDKTVDQDTQTTSWSPDLEFKAGDKVTWTVQAVDGTWLGPVSTGSFTVKNE